MSDWREPIAQAVAASPPWFVPYLGLMREALATAPADVATTLAALGAARPITLNAGRLRFVPQTELPAGEAYEAFIARTACVPSRDNLHDFFNGLVWLRFPQLKRRLNELQAEAIARDGVGATRGPVRDALTLFDENAAWFQPAAVLTTALRQRDWHSAFVTHRCHWGEAHVVCFGHALLEKLLQPRKPITAHAWPVPVDVTAPHAWLATHLSPERLAAKPHLPLPVLGVPGWWSANASPAFYADATVFRPLAPRRLPGAQIPTP